MKSILLFFAGIFILPFTAIAQHCNANILGTKTLYQAPAQKYTKPPVGYLPVFVNHVGRHGARHLTKDVKTTFAYALLLRADSLNELSAKGKQLLQMINALQKIEKGNTKFISAEGKNELKGLGERMYVNYPNVFNGKLSLSVAITKEIRTKQSADAFLEGLNKKLKDSVSAKFYNDDVALRFYDLSPAYKSFERDIDGSEAMAAIGKANHFNDINTSVIDQFFNEGFLKDLDKDKQATFVADLFGFSTIVHSLKEEIRLNEYKPDDLNFEYLFTCDELEKLAEMDSMNEDLKKGPGQNLNGIQVRVAIPLLVNFLNTTDEFTRTGTYNACLRFAHAETIAPFAALLQLAPADKTINTRGSKINWDASQIIPLSANIQWVFYKRKGGSDYLVKVLLNEKEERIDGLDANSFPYYKWRDLRSFYMKKLKKLKIKLSDDMNQYLLSLK